jgi:hypothetical protein
MQWRTVCRKNGVVLPALPYIRQVGFRPWQPLHDAMKSHLPAFRQYFHETFAADHAKVCTGPDPELCGSTVLGDGNYKICRSICPCPSNRRITSRWLGKYDKVPCGRRPMRGKRTCFGHVRRLVHPPRKFFRRVQTARRFLKSRKCVADDPPPLCEDGCNAAKPYRGITWHRTKGIINAVFP